MGKQKTFVARFELDEDGYWAVVADLGGGKSAISDGQTLPKARRRIRQAIALALDVTEESFSLRDELALPRKAMTTLERYQEVKEQLRKDELEALKATKVAVQALSALGLSVRDAGDLLGLTGARVHQVLTE
jgi:predicted RNase H-like HicB family nuclease